MALDMSHADGPSDWFGFSPAVVVVAAVALIAGGWFFVSSRSDPYVEALTRVCEQHGKQIEAGKFDPYRAPGAPLRSLADVDWSNTVYHALSRSSAARRAAFQALVVPEDHEADHTALLEQEGRLVELTAAAATQFEEGKNIHAQPDPGMTEIFAENRQQSERLISFGLDRPPPPTNPLIREAGLIADACPI